MNEIDQQAWRELCAVQDSLYSGESYVYVGPGRRIQCQITPVTGDGVMYDNRNEAEIANDLLESIERDSREQLEEALRLERTVRAIAIASAAIAIPTLATVVWLVLL